MQRMELQNRPTAHMELFLNYDLGCTQAVNLAIKQRFGFPLLQSTPG